MIQGLFHPLVAGWFAERFGEPTAPQAEGWRQIASGRHTLIAAPTGSGKTLAAFLWSINRLLERALGGTLPDLTQVVYVSPLKALSNDIQKNLQEPLRALRERAETQGLALPEIRVAVRTGDTPAADRARMLRKPPHILITTPESLFILLTAQGSRQFLAAVETVIVDEIHAVAGDKRGSHLAVSIERLEALAGGPVQRIGLSATQKPIAEIAALLVGDPQPPTANPQPPGRCAIVDVGHRRPLHLTIELPDFELGPIATHELWADIYDRIVERVESHRSTIVFVNTRRLVERVAHQLGQRLGDERVAAHHGSLSRETRLSAEQALKSGTVSVMVATASLELGIDIGYVDLVCHIGAPRLFSTLLQRVGRSGHWLGATPKGILYPLTRDDLLQAAAAIRGVRAGQLDRISIPEKPMDILAQQMVAIAASEREIGEDALFNLIRRAYPYRNLEPREFEALLIMLSEGIATGRGRRSAHLHRDRVHRVLRPRRGARLAAITSGGAIPDLADYEVIEDPAGTLVGKVHEDFAVESLAGDIFLLGNHSWRIRRVETGRLRVEDAQGAPPTIPFWLGEAPARSWELSGAVADLRAEVAHRISGLKVPTPHPNPPPQGRREEAVAWLEEEVGLTREGAEQIVEYVDATLRTLGTVPTLQTVVAERFFDEAGGMQLIVHAPFGGRVNRAWGMALRKRFCVSFNQELQAAATDDGIVISLGERHSFPLESVFAMVRPATLEADLTQAALQSPMFTNRWRWNASRALALLRFQNGRRVPMNIQRMRAEDLLAAVFPDQIGCQDNQVGPIVPPDHPLVAETIDNCLHEAMDLDGLRDVLLSIERGEIHTVAVETPAPSAMSHEILNANPYAFLDDAPLEERRARAVSLRRTDPDLARGIGALDPEAIAAVRAQAWPDVRDAEELHDFLLTAGLVPQAELGEWRELADQLIAAGRAAIATWATPSHPQLSPPPPFPLRARRKGVDVSPSPSRGQGAADLPWALWASLVDSSPSPSTGEGGGGGDGPSFTALVAAERIPLVEAACGRLRLDPPTAPPPGVPAADPDEAPIAIVQGWLEALGPITSRDLADRLGLPRERVETALAALEGRGVVLRGRFTQRPDLSGPPAAAGRAAAQEVEWCERRLLARIHRLTLGRLRQEIQPVAAADFLRFLTHWQHLAPGTQLHGRDGVAAVVGQLQGLELPAPAWESWVLPSRLVDYEPDELERLCLAGLVAWGRLSHYQPPEEPPHPLPRGGEGRVRGGPSPRRRRALAPGRQAPLAFLLRNDLPSFLGLAPLGAEQNGTGVLSAAARDVAEYLARRGASFLGEIARGTRRMPAEVEDALWELVATGFVTGDGIAGLRVLLQPESKRRPTRHLRAIRGGRGVPRMMPVGRWALWGVEEADRPAPTQRAERFAWQLLRRYGVVFRDLLARESQAPPWRVVLAIYRRLEAQGEIRGGRFVAGFVGEQYALPEAVEALRAVRRASKSGELALVHSGDPLNLVGILTPGGRVSPYSNQVVAYRDGEPIDVGPVGAVRSRLQMPKAT